MIRPRPFIGSRPIRFLNISRLLFIKSENENRFLREVENKSTTSDREEEGCLNVLSWEIEPCQNTAVFLWDSFYRGTRQEVVQEGLGVNHMAPV